MYKKHDASKNSTLQEMVKIKRLRFKDIEDKEKFVKPTKDACQRRVNFEDFRAAYGDAAYKQPKKNLKEDQRLVYKTQSGSLCKFPRVYKEPQHVETINIELPKYFGADRAVVHFENKIKPKRIATKVSREILTENLAEKLKRIEEETELEEEEERHLMELTKQRIKEVGAQINEQQHQDVKAAQYQLKEIQKHIRARKEKISKALPKSTTVKPKKKQPKSKIMSALSTINEKLQKMQEKYFSLPRYQYKSVNDCFTQSANVEVLFERDKSSYQLKEGKSNFTCDLRKLSNDVIHECKMQERIREMNQMFPEFPKIEDTLKEIEVHLDNIVNLEITSGGSSKRDSITMSSEPADKLKTRSAEKNLATILGSIEHKIKPSAACQKDTSNETQCCAENKFQTIRHQIEMVEDFCDKLSEIANDESDAESVSSVSDIADNNEQTQNFQAHKETKKIDNSISNLSKMVEFIEGQDLPSPIKKSSYLTKEFKSSNDFLGKPMVKIFSDTDKKLFLREKLRFMQQNEKTDFKSVESVTKLIDNLKFTLEHSIYDPVG